MAGRGSAPQAGGTPSSKDLRVPLTALPTFPPTVGDRVVDLAARRAAAEAAVRAVADAPVRHLPAALLDALQGSWGTPQELLGARVAPVRLRIAR
jgi:hypothetical protein